MKTVVEYLENSAKKTPKKIAVRDPEHTCTYEELLENAQKIGTMVSKYSSVRKPIAVYMEKSIEAVTALMGIAYADCFYVYLNSEQTTYRICQILDSIKADCIITDQEEQVEKFGFKGTILEYKDAGEQKINLTQLKKIRAQALDIDPLYCNYTSGSTGNPKGVIVSHRSVIDFMEYFPKIFSITEEDVIGNQAPFDFDVSVKDIYSSIKVGATLVLIPKKYFSIVTTLIDYLCECKVTTLIWVASALCLIAQFKGFSYRTPEYIMKVLFSGEKMPVKYLNIWRKYLPNASYVNLYGPTEVTCNCTYYKITRPFDVEEEIPIGKAFPNEKVFLLDEDNHLVTKEFVDGEICVSGTALALGYYNNSSQSEQHFMQNPLNLNYIETIYRTGDLAYYNEARDLCFRGRKDFQIKYMGHRMELEEIEAAMNRLPEIERACCGFNTEKNSLIAFYCGKIEPKRLKVKLYELLPKYMIPRFFNQLSTLPFTNGGKINRKKLMEMETEKNG